MLFLSEEVFVGQDELQEKEVDLRDFLGGCSCDERRSWTACSIMMSAPARVSTSEGVGGGRGGGRDRQRHSSCKRTIKPERKHRIILVQN